MNLVHIAPFASWFLMGQALRKLKQRLAPKAPKTADDLAREAAEARAMAYQYLTSDPGFAGDLFAAANRHELTAAKLAEKAQARP